MTKKEKHNTQYQICKKYFENRSTEKENILVHHWLSQASNDLHIENILRQIWSELAIENQNPEINLGKQLDKIHHTINLNSKIEKEGPNHPNHSFRKKTSRIVTSFSKAAAILLVPLIGYFSWLLYDQRNYMVNQSELVYHEIICPLGARSQFELPDGTIGNLNNGSRLIYPVKFTGDTREVELIGEAFFNVTEDKKRPFIIKTSALNVRVLGTKVNVYSYPDENYQEFTLESGIAELVKIENNKEVPIIRMNPGQHLVYNFEKKSGFTKLPDAGDEVLILDKKEELDAFLKKSTPRQQAVYEMKEGELEIIIDETENFTSWKEGKLVLRNDPMPRLLKRIERWYNVEFNIIDEGIKDFTYWATFEAENLDQVLKLLSLTGPINFQKQPRDIKPNGTYGPIRIDVRLNKN